MGSALRNLFEEEEEAARPTLPSRSTHSDVSTRRSRVNTSVESEMGNALRDLFAEGSVAATTQRGRADTTLESEIGFALRNMFAEGSSEPRIQRKRPSTPTLTVMDTSGTIVDEIVAEVVLFSASLNNVLPIFAERAFRKKSFHWTAP